MVVASIRFEHVTKTFGDVIAVNDSNFEISEGEFFTLLGPSGCGKSTTLRLIAGLEIPDEGHIFIGKNDVTRLLPGQRNIAMVFQNYALYPHMTLFQNIAYPLSVRKVQKNEIDERVSYVAKNLQIESLLKRYPMEISGGQQQRVALARAIIQTPNAFLLDEPLSNLDAKLRLEARSFLKHLHLELGTTIVYVTHDQAEAMALSSRIAVMKDGMIMQIASPREVYERPSDIFVAGFIGNPPMNLIKISIDNHETYIGTQRLNLHNVIDSLSVKPLGNAFLGIRPEHVKIALTGDVKAEVYVVEPLGAEFVITLKIGDQFLKVLTFEELQLSPGEIVWIEFIRDRIQIFDSEGKRIKKKNEEEWK